MKLAIPEISTEIKLTEPWTFSLHWEKGNKKMFEYLVKFKYFDSNNVVDSMENYLCGSARMYSYYHKMYSEFKSVENRFFSNQRHDYKCYNLTLPTDTILRVSKYNIKPGRSAYSKVHFSAYNRALFKALKPKFWASLHEVNCIQYEPV